MSWQEGVAIGLVLVGLAAGGYIAAQRPAFWIEFGSRLFSRLLPLIWAYISKPESDEVRAARWRCERMAGKWNPHTKKCDR